MKNHPQTDYKKLSRILWFFIAIHFLLTGFWGMISYYNLHSSIIDLGVFDQAFRTLKEFGTPYYSAGLEDEHSHMNQSWLGGHTSYLVLLLYPLYHLFPDFPVLNLVQSFVLALPAWPIFKTCIALNAKPQHALFWSLLYLCNPYILNEAFWDFHELGLAAPMVAYGLYFTVTKRFIPLLICCLLMLVVKEHLALSVSGFGILWAWRHKDKKRGLILILLGAIYLFLALKVILPYFREGVESLAFSGGRFSYLQEGLTAEVITSLIITKLAFAIFILFPLGFAPLFGIFFIFAGLGDLSATILDATGTHGLITSRHNSTLIPALIIASCYGSFYIRQKFKFEIVYVALIFTALFAGTVNSYSMYIDKYKDLEIRFSLPEEIYEIREILPKEAEISAQPNIGTHFTRTPYIYSFPQKVNKVDYIILHLDYPFEEFSELVLGSPYFADEYIEAIEAIIALDYFGIIYMKNNWVVLRFGGTHIEGGLEKFNDRIEWMKETYNYDKAVIELKKIRGPLVKSDKKENE